jgi:hypothetical protein
MSAQREQFLFLASSPPGTTERPVSRVFTQSRFHRIILDVFDRFVEVFFVSYAPIKIIIYPEFA